MKKFLAARYAFTKDVRKILAQFVSLAYYTYIPRIVDRLGTRARRSARCVASTTTKARSCCIARSIFRTRSRGGAQPLSPNCMYVYLSVSHPVFSSFFFSFLSSFSIFLRSHFSADFAARYVGTKLHGTWWGWAEGVNKDARESLYSPVPFSPLGRMRASYRPGPRMLSSTCFSFSRKFTFTCVVCVHLEKNIATIPSARNLISGEERFPRVTQPLLKNKFQFRENTKHERIYTYILANCIFLSINYFMDSMRFLLYFRSYNWDRDTKFRTCRTC